MVENKKSYMPKALAGPDNLGTFFGRSVIQHDKAARELVHDSEGERDDE